MLAVVVVGRAMLSLPRDLPERGNMECSLSLFAGVTIASTVILFIAFLWYTAVVSRPWYFIPPLALVAACFDCGIPLSAPPRLLRVAVFGFLIGTALIAAPAANDELRVHFTNVDRLAARVGEQSSPQDFIVVAPWFCGLTFSRYYHGSAPWQTLPPLPSHLTHSYDLILKQMSDTNSLAPVLDKISATLRSGHRVWIVGLLPDLQPGSAEPPVLPPPPLPGSGWSDTAYNVSWSARTEFYLVRHAGQFGLQTDASYKEGNLQENLHLFMAEGWHD
jgi:hypothetical protein